MEAEPEPRPAGAVGGVVASGILPFCNFYNRVSVGRGSPEPARVPDQKVSPRGLPADCGGTLPSRGFLRGRARPG